MGLSVYLRDPGGLEGLVTAHELAAFLGQEVTPDSFAVKAAAADAVWYYDGSGYSREMRMHIGEEGIIAVRGCTVLAQRTLVIYN